MQVHTRIEAKPSTDDHHFECEKEHSPIELTFTSTTEGGGRCVASAMNCLLFEIEDTAQATVTEAWEESDSIDFWSIDDESAREAAVAIAERADRMDEGESTHVYHDIGGMAE